MHTTEFRCTTPSEVDFTDNWAAVPGSQYKRVIDEFIRTADRVLKLAPLDRPSALIRQTFVLLHRTDSDFCEIAGCTELVYVGSWHLKTLWVEDRFRSSECASLIIRLFGQLQVDGLADDQDHEGLQRLWNRLSDTSAVPWCRR